MKEYTIGEIYRLGLLKNHKGEPYKHRATITKLVKGMKWREVKTPFGISKVVSQSEINKHNKRLSVYY